LPFWLEGFDAAFGAASAEPLLFSGLESDFVAVFFSSAILNFPTFERIKKVGNQQLSTPFLPPIKQFERALIRFHGFTLRIRNLATNGTANRIFLASHIRLRMWILLAIVERLLILRGK
jgi:hypothetical protein